MKVCKNCGQEIDWTPQYRGKGGWVHDLTGGRYCLADSKAFVATPPTVRT